MSLFTTPSDPTPNPARVEWVPTRAAGLSRLDGFVPFAGQAYARDRNVDRGPTDRANVSGLSPWIRRRMLTEDEVIATILNRHSFASAEKFIQEVYWRTYWKGWLEMRPNVLTRFLEQRDALRQVWADDTGLRRAVEGRTGIACFDAWAAELIDTGWLHNHARMWFASIWIFTLRLPWQLGADFFYTHLLDADPASNTLSWRWVAGLHTRGKHYLARAANIRDNSGGRFYPIGQLDERALPLTEDVFPSEPLPIPAPTALQSSNVGLLLTEEDLHAESWSFDAEVKGCAALMSNPESPVNTPAARFSAGALEDGLSRTQAHFGTGADMLDPSHVAAWAKALRVKEVLTGYAPVGVIAQALDALQIALAEEGIRLVRHRRDFDTRTWPHARAGFFKLKEKIPSLIACAP